MDATDRELITCIFCRELPPVHHMRCSRCDCIACFRCIEINEEMECDWMCPECVSDYSGDWRGSVEGRS